MRRQITAEMEFNWNQLLRPLDQGVIRESKILVVPKNSDFRTTTQGASTPVLDLKLDSTV